MEGAHPGEPLHRMGACATTAADAPLKLPAAEAVDKAPQVVLVCTDPRQGAAASMGLLGDVARLAERSGRSHAFLFVGRPPQASSRVPESAPANPKSAIWLLHWTVVALLIPRRMLAVSGCLVPVPLWYKAVVKMYAVWWLWTHLL